MFEKAGAYEELIHTKGWELIKVFVQSKLQLYTSDSISEKGFASYEEYRERKGEVNGLRGLLSEVQGALDFLGEERKKNATTTRPTSE